MFGIGPQELMIVALVLLIVFGPRKASSIARDVGHFVNETRRPVEEFKAELAAVVEDQDEPASHLNSSNGEVGVRKRATNSKLPGKKPSEDRGRSNRVTDTEAWVGPRGGRSCPGGARAGRG